MKRFAKPGIIVATILLFSLLFASCYWTPEEDEGAILLEIHNGRIGASDIEDYDGFFFGYVIADDLMRGDEAAAAEAFTEIDLAFFNAFDSFMTTGDPADLNVNVAFPSIQLQVNAFVGNSGSNTFGGLRAGREYLVVVDAFNYNTGIEGMAFTTTTIDAGQTKTVSLDLADNYTAFNQFLADRYGFVSESAQIAIVGGTGYYVDLLSGTSPDPPSTWMLDSEYQTWYASTTILSPAADEIDKTGTRTAMTDDPYIIEGVLPDSSWRLMITLEADRGTVTFFSFYLSDPFTAVSGQMTSLDFASGSGPGFTSYDVS